MFSFEVGHFTVDNTANNNTMIQALETMLAAHEIPFDSADCKVMCYGHIVDLSSGQVIHKAANVEANHIGDDDDDLSDDENVLSNPIALACSVVGAIQGSGMHRDAFDEVIVNGNAKGWFKQGQPLKTIKLKPLQLLRDVQTRWDSVYYMLNRLREMHLV